MNSNERYHSLDFVRAIAMLLGVLLHVSMHFAEHSKIPWAFNTWSTGESHGNVLNTNISNFIHLFRMQLFYLIAGFFAQLVIDRKGYELSLIHISEPTRLLSIGVGGVWC